eukprot:1188507-Prorocentrum_minimum.AAC.2
MPELVEITSDEEERMMINNAANIFLRPTTSHHSAHREERDTEMAELAQIAASWPSSYDGVPQRFLPPTQDTLNRKRNLQTDDFSRSSHEPPTKMHRS